MSEAPQRQSLEESRNFQIGNWTLAIIGIVYFIFFGFSALIPLRRGHFLWSDILFLILTGATFVSVVIGIVFIRRGRYALATSLVFVTSLLPPVGAAVILENTSLLASSLVLLTSFYFFFWVLPKKNRSLALWAGIAVILVSVLVDIINPAFQKETEGIEKLAPIVISITGAAFLALLMWQVWRRNIRPKLLVAIFVILGVVVFFQTGVNLRLSRELSEKEETNHLFFLYESYNDYVDAQAVSSAALSLSYADRDDIKDLYLAQDRDALFTLLSPIFERLKEENNIRHLYIENPDGTVFIRIHNRDNYGDDVTYRHTAAAALKTQETVAGVEVGPGRIGIRSVSPLLKDGSFIGMVEVGLDYDQAFVDDFKERSNADYNLWITYEAAETPGLKPDDHHSVPTEKVFHYVSSSEELISLPIPSDVYDHVLETKEPSVQFVSMENEELAVIVAPMLAYEGRVIGIVEIIESRTETLAAIAQTRQSVLIPAALLTLMGLLILGFAINQVVLRPVGDLITVAQKQIAGDLSARVEKLPPDEFGNLGETLNALSQQLDHTLKDQERVIAERTRSLEEHSAYLESSAEVSRQIAAITTPEELINEVVARIQSAFNLYYVGLFLVDKSNQWAVLEAGTGEAGKKMLASNHRLRIGEGMIGWSVKNAKSRIALDVGEDAVHFENPVLTETRSEGALPLRSRGRVLGALTIQSAEAEAFTPEIINTLQSMADQVGIALDNAELFAKSEAALSAERKAYGYLSEKDWLALLLKKEIPSYVSIKGTGIQLAKGHKKPIVSENKQVLDDEGLTAIIPIKVEGRILGGVKLRKGKEQGAWTKKELGLAEILIERPLSVALEGARLFEQTQRRAAQERVVGESAARIRETLDIESVLQTAAQELHKILGKVETEIWIDAE
ncbi:MAG: GAF domain-containing protein [Chloroflexi bacterium]|nr:GAF domain-containing protein [Chloroflexota bacterium]